MILIVDLDNRLLLHVTPSRVGTRALSITVSMNSTYSTCCIPRSRPTADQYEYTGKLSIIVSAHLCGLGHLCVYRLSR